MAIEDSKEEKKELIPENQGDGAPVTEQPENAPAITPSKKEELHALLKEVLGEGYNPEDEEGSSGALMDYVKGGRERQGKLAEALTSDPRVSQLLADVVAGKKNAHSALVRYFGKDFLSVEEGTPEYEEMMKQEQERMQELEDSHKRKNDYESNLEKSMPIIQDYCKENGHDSEEWLDSIFEKMLSPVFRGEYTPELCAMFDKAINYDTDIEDAQKAGEVKGRNMNINKMKSDNGDGLPKNIQSQAVEEKKKKGSSVLDLAALA